MSVSLDTSFTTTGINSNILSSAVQSDGKIIIGGTFTTVNGSTRNFIARLNSDGTLDTGFNPNLNASVLSNCISLQSDGKILIGGDFTTVGGVTRNRLARLNSDGTLDTSFVNPAFNGSVQAMALQIDGKVLTVGQNLAYFNSVWHHIVRSNTDGTTDTSFNISGYSYPFAITIQSDGKILIGGGFTSPVNYIARFNSNGTVDSGFSISTINSFLRYSIIVQTDGKIIICGGFTSVGGQTRNYIARLNSDGTLDTGFNPNANGTVEVIKIQSDNKILIGGTAFTTIGGTTRNRLARLNSDGTLDTGFNPNPGATSNISTIILQTDNKIIVGGNFNNIFSTTRNMIARIINDVVTFVYPQIERETRGINRGIFNGGLF